MASSFNSTYQGQVSAAGSLPTEGTLNMCGSLPVSGELPICAEIPLGGTLSTPLSLTPPSIELVFYHTLYALPAASVCLCTHRAILLILRRRVSRQGSGDG